MKVKIDYDVLEKHGKTIVEIADSYNEICSAIEKTNNTLMQKWNTDTSEVFTSKIIKLNNEMSTDKKKMQIFGLIMTKIKEKFELTNEEYNKLLKLDNISLEDLEHVKE